MSSINNPAGRLRELLARATQIRDRDTNAPADKAWASLLYVDPGDLAGMLRRLAIVVGLPKEAAAAVEGLPNLSHSLFLVWKPKVKAAFDELNIKGNFQAFVQYIDEPTLAMLAICDDLINKSVIEGTVDE